MTVLFVEHDMHMVRHIADWVVVMAEGRDRRRGRPAHRHAQPRGRSTPTSARTRSSTSASSPAASRPPRPTRRRMPPHPTNVEAPSSKLAGIAELEDKPSERDRHRDRRRRSSTSTTSCAGYLPGVNILNGCSLRRRPGRAHRHHRPERRRQVDAAEGDLRAGEHPRAARSCSTARTSPACSANKLVARGVGFVPAEQQRLPEPHDRREPADGAVPEARGRTRSASSS